MALEITLPDVWAARLQRIADRLGCSLDDAIVYALMVADTAPPPLVAGSTPRD